MKIMIITNDEPILEEDYDKFEMIAQAEHPSDYSIFATKKSGNETTWNIIREDELFRRIKQIMWEKK
jgi:hypothetical protein